MAYSIDIYITILSKDNTEICIRRQAAKEPVEFFTPAHFAWTQTMRWCFENNIPYEDVQWRYATHASNSG